MSGELVLPDDLLRRLPSPALVISLDRVRRNVGRVIDALGGRPDRWRPHVKTVKTPAVLAELVRSGLRSFKCATTREAACMLDVLDAEGVRGDVLLAHPLVGPGLDRLAALAGSHPGARVSVLCEDPGAVASIPEPLGIFADVNPGMDRTGIPADRLGAIEDLARRAGDRLGGVHCYEGHLAGLDPGERRRRAFACYDRLVGVLDHLERAGIAVPETITTGTPPLLDAIAYGPFAALHRHRVSPGTVVLADTRSAAELPELGLEYAAMVVARVVSHPAPGIVTCDAGSKSIAAETGDPCAVVQGRPDMVALRPSEEHLPFRVGAGAAPGRGTPIMLIPRHVCPTVNLADEAILLDGPAFVGVAPVAARAHDSLGRADADIGARIA